MKKWFQNRRRRLHPSGQLLAAALLIGLLAGCQKSEPVPLREYTAHLALANPAADGPGVDELMVDSTHESLVPINKKDGWPQTQPEGLTPVGIRFIDTGKTVPVSSQTGRISYLRLVYIVTFRRL